MTLGVVIILHPQHMCCFFDVELDDITLIAGLRCLSFLVLC